jgi:Protein of unknown function (DUF1376)
MSDELPLPPVPSDVDLRDFGFTPLFRARLFGSSFHARASDSEWRAGVTLWLKSWDQVPAGSLPDDDTDLCRLAELGRNLKTWLKLKQGALRGWFKCSDGRLYHHVVTEGVLEAYQKRRIASDKGKSGALKRWGHVNGTGNGTRTATAIAGAMPGDSNRQGSEGKEEPPHPPLRGGLPVLSHSKSPERARRDASRAAWAQSELARKTNDFDGLKRADPTAAEAVRLIGGFSAIGMSNTDRLPQLRRRFRETYESLIDRRESAA